MRQRAAALGPRLWPLIAFVAMLAVGLAVGKASTPIDDWFGRHENSVAWYLVTIADPRVLIATLLVILGVALYQRRWWLSAMTVTAPLTGIAVVRLLKPIFEREKEGGLAYPSGHVTATVIVVGLVVIAAGSARWAVALAVVAVPLVMVGVGVTFHYFTDTVGGLLLGSAVAGVAAAVAKLDTRQPACDADHTAG